MIPRDVTVAFLCPCVWTALQNPIVRASGDFILQTRHHQCAAVPKRSPQPWLRWDQRLSLAPALNPCVRAHLTLDDGAE